MRLIYFAQPRDHAIPFFIKSNCLPLQSLFFQQSSYLMYDVHTKTASKSLLNKFAKSVQNIIIIRDYPQRNVCLLISLELKTWKTSFTRISVSIWNSIPHSVKTLNLPQGHPTAIFGKISVRKTIWELEFSEHLL